MYVASILYCLLSNSIIIFMSIIHVYMYIVFHEVPYIPNTYITLACLKPNMYSYILH